METAITLRRKYIPNVKTTALVTAAALLFGVVARSTMFGVNRAASLAFPSQSTQAASSETIGQTAQIPAANTSTTSEMELSLKMCLRS